MATYLNRFSAKLADLSDINAKRAIQEERVPWLWELRHQQALDRIKQ